MNIVIDVKINSSIVTLCIDTGADSSIIYDKDYEIMRSLVKDKIPFKHIRNMQISNLNGVQTTGFYELPIMIGNDEFVINTAVTDAIDEVDAECGMHGIIGMDFMNKNNAIIDISKSTMSLNEKEYEIRKIKTLFLFSILAKKRK